MFAPLLVLTGILLTSMAAPPPRHWFIFGDSYSLTAFNWHSTQPNDVNPFGNPTLPGVTACGTVPNYVYYASVKYNTTTVYTYNFARGGATINETIVPPYVAAIPTIVDQVKTFEASYTGPSPLNTLAWTGDNSLFSVWIGINDIDRSFFNNSTVNVSALHDELIASHVDNLQNLFDLGARNFLILSVPPIDRSPQILSLAKVDQDKYRASIHDFNAKLIEGVAAFKLANPTAAMWKVDTYLLLTNIFNDPAQYGFVDAVHYGSDPGLVWCNGYHISPGVHDYVAQRIHVGLSGSGLL